MNHNWRVRLAGILAAIGILLYFLGVVFAYLNSSPRSADYGPLYDGLITGLPILTGLILGCVLIVKLPKNPYGWVWIILGLSFALSYAGVGWGSFASMQTKGVLQSSGEVVSAMGNVTFLIALSMFPLVMLLFPTGYPPTRHWRILLWVYMAALLIGFCSLSVLEMPGQLRYSESIGGAWGEGLRFLSDLALAILALASLLSVVSLLHRYQLADQVGRKQLLWFVYGALLFVLAFVGDNLYEGPGFWESLMDALMVALLPISIGIAILRYRLYDIDIIIRKTLQYGVLSALLALIYFGSIILIQAIFGSITGEQSPIVIVLSTLLIAALFTPLRRRVQDVIDRRFFRKKYDAAQVLADFARTARDETDLDALTAELARVVEETMQPERVSVWLRQGDKP